jgi:hypothetical protein
MIMSKSGNDEVEIVSDESLEAGPAPDCCPAHLQFLLAEVFDIYLSTCCKESCATGVVCVWQI